MHLKALGEEPSKFSPAWKTPQRQTSAEGKEAYLQVSFDTSVAKLQIRNFKACLNSFMPLKHKFFLEFLLICSFSVQYNPLPLLTIYNNICFLRLP